MEILFTSFALIIIGFACGAQNHLLKRELKAITSRLINIQCRLTVIEDELSEIKEAKQKEPEIKKYWK